MALRILQFGIVFAIGYYLGPASPFAGAVDVPEVPPLPIQLKDPKDVTVGKGQPATLRCEAKSLSGGLQITWLHNDNPIRRNDTKRRIQDDGSLYIPKVGGKRNNSLAGEYRCRATAQNLSILSNPAKLRIASFGDFTKQPSNLSVPESQPAVLLCNIHSVPAAQIKWEQNNKSLPHNTRYVPLPTGALLITKTHSSDAGSYRCIATNSLLKKNTKHSKIVQLTVTSNPMKTVAPTFLPLDILPNTTVLVGGNINLYCAVTGWPIPTVQWLNNNSIVISNSSILQFRNASLHDTGNFTCRAFNSVGQTAQKYTLEVQQKPYFNTTPKSVTYPPARTVRLDCKVEGVPKPKIYWFKNGEPVPNEVRIKRQPTGLVFSHTFSSDSGIYQCFASNAAGKIWAAAQLIQTTFKSPSPPVNVQCRPFDQTSICLTWQSPQNTNVTAYSIYSFYTVMGHATSGPEFVTNETHHLATGLNGSTNYTFYVRLYSKIASDQSQEVTCKTGVTGKRNLRVKPINETTVELTWSNLGSDVPCDESKKEAYRVQWKPKGRSSIKSDVTEDFAYVISGLSYSVEYEFRVTSRWIKNDNSAWLTFSALDYDDKIRRNISVNATDMIPPERLDVSLISATSVNLTWLDNNDNTFFYTICVIDLKKQSTCDESELKKSVSNYLQITDLESGTSYEFKVRAHSPEGYYSMYSEPFEIPIPPSGSNVPLKGLHLEYWMMDATTACLYWQTPIHKGGKVTNFLVSYTADNNLSVDKWLNKSVTIAKNNLKGCKSGDEYTFSTMLADLEPEKQYTVYVRAISDVSFGTIIHINTNHMKNLEQPELQDDFQYNQKLGIIMGVSISLTCVIFCISCILVRKRCLKTRAFARARMAASNNYYPAVAHYASEGSSVQVRLENPCLAEIHEIEHLVSDDSSNHIPAVTPAHLDTKGNDGFPNGHINGSAKPYINGHIANGIVHITENPRYYVLECNGHVEKSKPQEMFCSPYEEDSNSNLKTSKFHDLHRLFENSKVIKIPDMTNHKSNRQCNSHLKNSASKLNDNSKTNSSFKDVNPSPSSSEDSSLNSTQLTCLDNSFIVSENNHRRVSPVLGPNG